MMPNWLAGSLITLGVMATIAAYIHGEIGLGTVALHSFALLIALNCQNWTKK